MQTTSLLRLFLFFIVLGSALQPSSAALAHDDDLPHIALSVSQAPLGATIEVVGEHFEPGARIAFVLVQNTTHIQLGALSAGNQGEFTAPVLLPQDLQPGQYEFHAIAAEHPHAIAPLTILLDAGGQQDTGLRDDSDSLLAPMPTFASAPARAAAAVPTPAIPASPGNPARPFSTGLLILLLALSAGAGLLIFRKR